MEDYPEINMVINPKLDKLKVLFGNYASKITFFPYQASFKFEIETIFSFTIIFFYEYRDELYNIKFRYLFETINLTSYKYYQNYVKRNLKRNFFKKKTLKDHIDILYKFIESHVEIFSNPTDFIKLITNSEKGYENMFVN